MAQIRTEEHLPVIPHTAIPHIAMQTCYNRCANRPDVVIFAPAEFKFVLDGGIYTNRITKSELLVDATRVPNIKQIVQKIPITPGNISKCQPLEGA